MIRMEIEIIFLIVKEENEADNCPLYYDEW